MKVKVHPDRCISTGQCVMLAPDVFDQSEEDGAVELLDEEPGPRLHAAVRSAVSACPAAAIELVDPAGAGGGHGD